MRQRDFSLFTLHFSLFTKENNSHSSLFTLHSSFKICQSAEPAAAALKMTAAAIAAVEDGGEDDGEDGGDDDYHADVEGVALDAAPHLYHGFCLVGTVVHEGAAVYDALVGVIDGIEGHVAGLFAEHIAGVEARDGVAGAGFLLLVLLDHAFEDFWCAYHRDVAYGLHVA